MGDDFILDDFQKEAIGYSNQGLSVVVSAPTGAGKTLIAEHIIEDCMRQGLGVIYTAPIKALSNQKFRDFTKKYPRKTGIITGDVNINPHAPVLIMTTEIFRNAILIDPQRFEQRKWIIFDEIHYLDDIERGTVWEETIILLPPHMRMLALSATLPNIDQFTAWLNSVHGFCVKKVIEKKRPVPLRFRFQCNNIIFRNIKELGGFEAAQKRKYRDQGLNQLKTNKLSSLIRHLESGNLLPCIYFSFSRRRCEELAQELLGVNLLDGENKKKIRVLFDELIKNFNIGHDPEVNFLQPLVRNGIAYHHAGMIPTLKEIVERLFTTGLLKLIFTTETFALGVNMPARTVAFDTLYKYYGRFSRYLKTRDFYQMAGRAGRRNIDTEGDVYIKVNPRHIDRGKLERIIYGKYEPINSQFRNCYATILNLYKLMQEKLYDIYPKSFHFQQADETEKRQALYLLKQKVSLLQAMQYIIDTGISAKAELASKVYSFELQIGEWYESGFLDTLDEVTLFTAICSLVYEPRKGERKPKISRRIRKLKKDTDVFIQNIHIREKKFHIYPLSKNFFFNLSEACQAWYAGCDFYRLRNFCAADEGEIVRYFRMTIQVLRETESSTIIEQSLRTKIKNCLRKVNRDIIDAEHQLRQGM